MNLFRNLKNFFCMGGCKLLLFKKLEIKTENVKKRGQNDKILPFLTKFSEIGRLKVAIIYL